MPIGGLNVLKQSLVLGLSALLIWGMALLTLRHYWRILGQQQELVRLANTDGLTGVANRRSLHRPGRA